jgi:outer membrane protein TolC
MSVRLSLSLSAVLALTACANPDLIAGLSATEPGFDTVRSTIGQSSRADTVWLQDAGQIRANAERVHQLVHERTINGETAVQVALLNNRGLQAAYAELGMTSAEIWQTTLQPNPTVSIGVLGIGAEGVGPWRAIEGIIANNILSLATAERRSGIAEVRFQQAQLRAAEETLRVAQDARVAWIDAVAAFERAALVGQAETTADAASEMAAQLGATGFLNRADQAREQAMHAEFAGQRARARLDAQLAKEQLTRILGLWGTEVNYYVPNALPGLPGRPMSRPGIEAEALARRVDLAIARLELEAVTREHGLTDATRIVSDLEIIAGVEIEREAGDDGVETVATPQIEIEFAIPIFDSGAARMRRAEMAYLQAAHSLAERAVNVRSEARSAHAAYAGSHRIAVLYRDTLVPLRQVIEREGQLSYNGMITTAFDLLADTRERLNANLMEADARAEFWQSEAALNAAIYGGGEGGGGGGGEAAAIGGGASPAH